MSRKVGSRDTLRGESSNLVPPKVEPLNTLHAKYAHYTLLYASNSLSVSLCERYPPSLTHMLLVVKKTWYFIIFIWAHAHCFLQWPNNSHSPPKVHETLGKCNFLLMSHTNASV